MFVNVTTKSAHHAHAWMIVIIVEKRPNSSHMYDHGFMDNTNRQAIKNWLNPQTSDASLMSWRQPFCNQPPPKTKRILTKVFYTYGPNLVFLAWAGDELSRGQASDYRTHGRTDIQTDAGNDNTRRPKLALDKKALYICNERLWWRSLPYIIGW